MPVRVAKHRIEMRVNGKALTLMPGQSFDFDPEMESLLDARGALGEVAEVAQVVTPEADPEPKPAKRARKPKVEKAAEDPIDELDA